MKITVLPLYAMACLALATAFTAGCQKIEPLPTVIQQTDIDSRIIREYLAANNITNYIRTTDSLYVVIDSAKTGEPAVQSGLTAFVKYRGYRPQTPTKAFDSTGASSPLRVEVGRTNVIRGWTLGLPYFRKKEKGRLLIPSRLGYGNTGSGIIGVNQVLIFDIEIKNLQ